MHALRDIDLKVEKGEIFGIIGHSGAGKSTLLRCVNLLEKPTSGTVKVGGVVIHSGLSEKELQERRKKIGMIFQHFNLLSTATVRENIAFPLKISKYPKKAIKQRVDELLELVGLADTETNIRHSSPAVRSSASGFLGRWLTIRMSCSVTRPHQPLIRRRRIRSSNCCLISTASWALPSCLSPTRCTSSARSAIG